MKWYENNKVIIEFNEIPQVGIRYYIPSMTKEEKKSIEKYPFICKKDLKVNLTDKRKKINYSFTVPKGYCYDGASIPRMFWRLIGSNTDNKFLIAALVHDVLCENHNYINNDRSFSTEVFNSLLESSGVFGLKRFLMKNSVDVFQKIFCKWRN